MSELDAFEQNVQETQEPKKRRKQVVQNDQDNETADESFGLGSISGDVNLGVYKIDPENTFELKFQTDDAACFDLAGYFKEGDRVKVFKGDVVSERKVMDDGLVIHHGERALIPTGLIFDIPQGYCMEIYARSGTSLKIGLVLNNAPAQIDSDYVNELFISIANTGDSKYLVSGDRIAQAKLVRLVPTKIVALDTPPSQKTNRVGGFGSTNK